MASWGTYRVGVDDAPAGTQRALAVPVGAGGPWNQGHGQEEEAAEGYVSLKIMIIMIIVIRRISSKVVNIFSNRYEKRDPLDKVDLETQFQVD